MFAKKSLKNKLKKICLENFERKKTTLTEIFAEQSVRDHGFLFFKNQLSEFDRKINDLQKNELNSQSPSLTFSILKKISDQFEEIKQNAFRFSNGAKLVTDLEFKSEFLATQNSFTLNFPLDHFEFDIQDRLKNVFKTREVISDETNLKKRTKSFLDNLSNNMGPVYSQRGAQLSSRSPFQVSPINLPKVSIFSTREFNESKSQQKSSLNSTPKDNNTPPWDTEIISESWETPFQKMGLPTLKFLSGYEPPEQLIHSISNIDSLSKNKESSRVKTQSLVLKPGQSKAFVSQKKTLVDGFQSNCKNAAELIPEIGTISNQAIDESKFKLMFNEVNSNRKMFSKIEFQNNTFKCNYAKILKLVLFEKLACPVFLDETKNRMTFKHKLSNKELAAFKEMNFIITQGTVL